MYRTIILALVSPYSGAFWRILADFGFKTPIPAFILLLVIGLKDQGLAAVNKFQGKVRERTLRS